MTSEDKGKHPEESEWVHRASGKKTKFDLEHTKETFMEVNKSFTEASTSESKENLTEEMDLSMITTFLETCMKFLCDSKVVKGMKELINRCVGKENTTDKLNIVRKLGKHKVGTRCEMRLTT